MNLIEQFPDVSMKMREKCNMRRKKYRQTFFREPLTYNPDRTLAKFYEREFRKLHLKVFVIIAALLAGFYLIMLNSRWLYQGITSLTSQLQTF